MKKINLKSKISTISIILILLMSTIPFTILTIWAQENEPIMIESQLWISATPNPIGINQDLAIMWWLSIPPPTATGVSGPRWEGLLLNFRKPDGSVDIIGPYKSDANGGAFALYTPTQIGTYEFWAEFPGQWINTTSYNRYYEPSTSKTLEIVAQADPILPVPEHPLPTEYWTRPINAENRIWYAISGNWLMAKYDKDAIAFEGSGNWNPYTTAPNTGHIMWTKNLQTGGIAGGDAGYGVAYYAGLNYEARFRPPLIINGILYYETAEPPRYGIHAVDVRTGETLWYKNYSYGSGFNALKFGQVLNYESRNQHGPLAYLWFVTGSTYHMHDAFTGNYILSIANVPSGEVRFGPHGEIMVYRLRNSNGYYEVWNSSAIPTLYGSTNPNSWTYDEWRPDSSRGETIDGTVGIQMHVNITQIQGAGNSIRWFDDDLGIFVTSQKRQANDEAWPTFVDVGYNATNGEVLWTANRTNIGDVIYPVYIQPYNGIYVQSYREKKQWIAWSIETGEELWRTEGTEEDWGVFDVGGGFAYDIFYTSGFAGIVTAYNLTNGEKVWEFDSGNSGLSTSYGRWGFYGASIIADGKIFIAHNEHSPNQPLWRGMKMWAIDAHTGEGVWNMSGAYQGGRNAMGALADGILVTHNAMDNRIYAFGKGPSSITVSAQPKAIAKGTSVVVEGTVIDEVAGAKTPDILSRFPNGVPLVSDASMTSWMEYVHMQFPRPSDAVGVPVRIQIVEPSGEYAWIGTATSDLYGNYAYSFIPQMEGLYKIIVTFDGSESYWGSETTTYIQVDPAPTYPSYPGYQGPSAQEVANSVVASLPADATPQQVADAVVNAMPEYPETPDMSQVAQIPDIATMNIIIIVAIAIAIIIGLVSLVNLFRKK